MVIGIVKFSFLGIFLSKASREYIFVNDIEYISLHVSGKSKTPYLYFTFAKHQNLPKLCVGIHIEIIMQNL